MPQELVGKIAWEVLFSDIPEEMPDPNLPENQAYHRAMANARSERIKKFFEGVGKPLFDEWQNKIRAGMFSILTGGSIGCSCALTAEVNELRAILKMLAEAQTIIDGGKKNG